MAMTTRSIAQAAKLSAQGWTQKELADLYGVSPTTIARYVLARQNASAHTNCARLACGKKVASRYAFCSTECRDLVVADIDAWIAAGAPRSKPRRRSDHA
jgi:transcriptional regulator with XRE-family HTH domain